MTRMIYENVPCYLATARNDMPNWRQKVVRGIKMNVTTMWLPFILQKLGPPEAAAVKLTS
eukprot:scaffold447443_cov32-Prasinocladus_malaysianus.AAC.2